MDIEGGRPSESGSNSQRDGITQRWPDWPTTQYVQTSKRDRRKDPLP
jgi:hypothetical protein